MPRQGKSINDIVTQLGRIATRDTKTDANGVLIRTKKAKEIADRYLKNIENTRSGSALTEKVTNATKNRDWATRDAAVDARVNRKYARSTYMAGGSDGGNK